MHCRVLWRLDLTVSPPLTWKTCKNLARYPTSFLPTTGPFPVLPASSRSLKKAWKCLIINVFVCQGKMQRPLQRLWSKRLGKFQVFSKEISNPQKFFQVGLKKINFLSKFIEFHWKWTLSIGFQQPLIGIRFPQWISN